MEVSILDLSIFRSTDSTFHEDSARTLLTQLFLQHDYPLEVRVIGNKAASNFADKQTLSGFYTDPEKIIQDVKHYSGKRAITVGLNPRKKSVLFTDRVDKLVGGGSAGGEADVAFLRYFLIDIESVRPRTDISATDEELGFTILAGRRIREYLASKGADLMAACSGNGTHLLLRTPDCEVNEANKTYLKNLIKFLSKKFNSDVVKIDEGVYDPPRVVKLWGSMAIKGANHPERPHRISQIIGGL